MLCYSYPGARSIIPSKDTVAIYLVFRMHEPFHYLPTQCSLQSPNSRKEDSWRNEIHSAWQTCCLLTDFEANREAASPSEDGAEGAICRQGLAGARRLAVGIDGGFSVSSWESQHRYLVGLHVVVGTYRKVKPTNKPLPICSSRSAMFSNAVCLSCTSLYLAISASLLKSSK